MFLQAFLDPRRVAQEEEESAFVEPQVKKEQAQHLLRKLSTDPRTLYPYTGPAPVAPAGGWASALGFTSVPLDSATLESAIAIAKARFATDGTAAMVLPPPLPVRKGGKKQIKPKPAGAIGKASRPKKAAVKKGSVKKAVVKKVAVKAVTNVDAKNDERWHTWLAGNPVEPSAASIVSFKL